MLFRQQVNPNEVAAIMIEPVQGEGGYVSCPPAFMHHLREQCTKHGIVLIVDEVQSGFFRTGSYFNVERLGPDFAPDVLIMAKGLANGFPISGIASRKELMDKVDKGSLGGTYAGNAVACAAGVAAQEVFQTQDIAGNVARRSEQLFSALNEMAQAERTKHLIAEVRGEGVSAVSRLFLVFHPYSFTQGHLLSFFYLLPFKLIFLPCHFFMRSLASPDLHALHFV